MKILRVLPLLMAVAALGACEFVSDGVAPSVGVTGSTPIPDVVPLDISQLGAPSGTAAGMRIAQYRDNLAQLQQAAVQEVQRGKQLQADMEAGVASYQISAGTLTQQGAAASDASVSAWRNAQAQLQTVSATLDQMSALSGEVAKNVAFTAFLSQSIQETSKLPDTTVEDNRQLVLLQDATKQTSASLDQLLDGLRQDVFKQSHFLGTEGAKLAQLAPPSAAIATSAAAAPQQQMQLSGPGPAGAGLATGRPFVVIRFDNPGVEYEQELYDAVSAALQRSPEVAFDLVAVAPANGTPEDAEAARASTQKVMQSLLEMGLPADRISLSQVTDPNVSTNEVHLYVR